MQDTTAHLQNKVAKSVQSVIRAFKKPKITTDSARFSEAVQGNGLHFRHANSRIS